MHKRGDAKYMLGATKLRERVFVLKDGLLHYFKNPAHAKGGSQPAGTIVMSEVHEVRLSKDPAAPDQALDIWTTAGRVYVVVPMSEDAKHKWLAILTQTVEEYANGDTLKAVCMTRNRVLGA
jgi:hypothetical protein